MSLLYFVTLWRVRGCLSSTWVPSKQLSRIRRPVFPMDRIFGAFIGKRHPPAADSLDCRVAHSRLQEVRNPGKFGLFLQEVERFHFIAMIPALLCSNQLGDGLWQGPSHASSDLSALACRIFFGQLLHYTELLRRSVMQKSGSSELS